MGFFSKIFGRGRPAAPAPPPTAPEPTHARTDGYFGPGTGIGGPRDPGAVANFFVDGMSIEQCRDVYRGNSIAKKIVEYKVKAAFREGFEIKTQDKELSDKIAKGLDELGATPALRLAGFYERAYGGSAILPIINDGGDLAEPLVPGRMTKIDGLLVLEPQELWPAEFYRSIYDGPKFGLPSIYQFTPRANGFIADEFGMRIHESRMIIFPGARVSRRQISAAWGWGDSALVRPNRAIAQFGMTWAGIATLLSRIEQGVLKMAGFRDMIADDEDGTVVDGLGKLNSLRNLLDMLVVDGADEYQRLGVPLTGVSSILEKQMLILSAESEIPAAWLVGMSPTGLHSTGDAETRNWYDSVAEEQADHFKPRLNQLALMYMQTNDAPTRGKVPESWSTEFRPLWQATEKEIAERNSTQAQADKVYLDGQVLTRAQVLRARFGGDTYSLNTTVTPKEIDELEKLEEAPTTEEIAAAAAARAPAPDEPTPPAEPAAPPPEPNAKLDAEIRSAIELADKCAGADAPFVRAIGETLKILLARRGE